MKIIQKTALILSLFVMAFAFTPMDAQAQTQTKRFGAAKALPEIPFMPAEQFESATRLIRDKSPDDQYLAYEARVPNDWTEVENEDNDYWLSSKLLRTLKEFESPIGNQNKKSSFSIQAIELKSPTTPERWLLEYMLSLGYHIEYMGVHNATRAEALLAYINRGQSYLLRSVVEINGQKALLAKHRIPIEAWGEQQVMQAQMLDSFKLLNAFEGEAENYQKYSFLDIAELRYPYEWQLKADPLTNPDRMEANVLNVPLLAEHLKTDTEINGRVQVEVISKYGTDSLDTEIERKRAEFTEAGFNLEKQFEVDMQTTFRMAPEFEFVKVWAYKTPDSNKRVLQKELWYAVMGAGDFYYLVTLYSPSRQAQYYTWLRNTEVYKMVVEGLRPNLRTTIFK